MRSIKDRLRSSGALGSLKQKSKGSRVSLKNIMDIEEIKTPFGKHMMKKHVFPLKHKHGKFTLASLFELPSEALAWISKTNGFSREHIRDLVFLDTETTGLAGGTGTVAFLVGIGYFQRENFVVDQFFMRDFHEEPSLLHGIKDLLRSRRGLVSFNGKVFDWPLLKDRFTMHRIQFDETEWHFDLLFASRRIWRERLASCSLNSIEENILEVKRKDDIPGELIPSVYFNYIRNQEAEPIKKVFEHNLKDILSLVTLMGCLGSVIHNPLQHSMCSSEDLYCLGRLFKSMGQLDRSCDCYLESAKRAQSQFIKQKALKELSFVLKKKGDYVKAVEIWKWMVSKNSLKIFPYVEWAKHLEHREKDYETAIKVVKRAIEIALKTRNALGEKGSSSKTLYELKHRLKRLQQKQSRLKQSG